jgi:hypothetical protein
MDLSTVIPAIDMTGMRVSGCHQVRGCYQMRFYRRHTKELWYLSFKPKTPNMPFHGRNRQSLS